MPAAFEEYSFPELFDSVNYLLYNGKYLEGLVDNRGNASLISSPEEERVYPAHSTRAGNRLDLVTLLPAITAMLNGVLVGSSIVATRFVIDQTSPASLALLRYTIGLGCLLPLTLLSARVRFNPRDLLPMALLGIMQFAVVVGLLNYALQYIPSARGALIFATAPLLTMILAALLRYERMTSPKALGVVLTIIGVGLALGEKALQTGTSMNSWIGELAVFGSAASAAVCSVFYRRYLARYPTLPVSTFMMFASVVFLGFFAAGEGFFRSFPQLTTVGWLAVGYMGLGSGLGYYLWLWALGRTTPTKVTVFLALSPLTATILGAVLLSEPISLTILAGLLSVVVGLWLVHWQPKDKRNP